MHQSFGAATKTSAVFVAVTGTGEVARQGAKLHHSLDFAGF